MRVLLAREPSLRGVLIARALAASILVVGAMIVVSLQQATVEPLPRVQLHEPLSPVTTDDSIELSGPKEIGERLVVSVDGASVTASSDSRAATEFQASVPLTVGVHRLHLALWDGGTQKRALDAWIVRQADTPPTPTLIDARRAASDSEFWLAIRSEPLTRVEIFGATEAGQSQSEGEWSVLQQATDRNGRLAAKVLVQDGAHPIIRLRATNQAAAIGGATGSLDVSAAALPVAPADAISLGIVKTDVRYDVSPGLVTRHVEATVPASNTDLADMLRLEPDSITLNEFSFPFERFLDRLTPQVHLTMNSPASDEQEGCPGFSGTDPATDTTVTVTDGVATIVSDVRVYVAPGGVLASVDPAPTLTICSPSGFPYLGSQGALRIVVDQYAVTTISLTPEGLAYDGTKRVIDFGRLAPLQRLDIGLQRSGPAVIGALFAPPYVLFPPQDDLTLFAIYLLSALPFLVGAGLVARLPATTVSVGSIRRLGLFVVAAHVIQLALLAARAAANDYRSLFDETLTADSVRSLLMATLGVLGPAVLVVFVMRAGLGILVTLGAGRGARLSPIVGVGMLAVAIVALLPIGPFGQFSYVRDIPGLLNGLVNAMARSLVFVNLMLGAGLLLVGIAIATALTSQGRDSSEADGREKLLRFVGLLLFALFVVGTSGWILGFPAALLLAVVAYGRLVLISEDEARRLQSAAGVIRSRRRQLLLRALGRRSSPAVTEMPGLGGVQRRDVLAVGGRSRADDVFFALRVALIPVVPSVLMFAIDRLQQSSSSPYPWQDIALGVASSIGFWLVTAGFFGLMFDWIRGKTGIRKAARLSLVVLAITVPFDLAQVAAGTATLTTPLYQAFQFGAVLMVTGLAFDVRALVGRDRRWWRRPRGIAKDLAVLSGGRYLLGSAGAVLTTIGVTVGAFLTGQMTAILKDIASKGLPGLGN